MLSHNIFTTPEYYLYFCFSAVGRAFLRLWAFVSNGHFYPSDHRMRNEFLTKHLQTFPQGVLASIPSWRVISPGDRCLARSVMSVLIFWFGRPPRADSLLFIDISWHHLSQRRIRAKLPTTQFKTLLQVSRRRYHPEAPICLLRRS